MVFKDKKIPKHLIIQDQYEIHQRPRSGLFKIFLVILLLLGLSLLVRFGAL